VAGRRKLDLVVLAAPPQGKNKSEPMPGHFPGHNSGRLLQGLVQGVNHYKGPCGPRQAARASGWGPY